MTSPTKVSVIIVSYNTREHTMRCLADLLSDGVSSVELDVVVVDNASHDGSADAVAVEFPGVRLLRLTENVGWGRAVNRGADMCTSPYLLLLNPDTRPVDDVIGRLVAFAESRPGHGIYSGRTLTVDGFDDGYASIGLPSLWSFLCFATGLSTVFKRYPWANPEGVPRCDPSSICEVPAVSGCIMLIERTLFHALEGFDPRYFLYSEDVDLSMRARRLGARPVVFPDASVRHICGASSNWDSREIRIFQGKMTYARRHWGSRQALVAGLLLEAGVLLRCLAGTALGAARSGRVDWRAVWAARRTWVAGYPAVDEARPRPLEWSAATL